MHAFPERRLHVEFYTTQDNSLHPRAARIHHCLLRVFNSDSAQALTKGLTTIGNTFTRFAYLETIVLETSHKLAIGDIDSLIEALQKASRADVQHRSFEEGHKLALQAKMGTARSPDTGLLSPFWCVGPVYTNQAWEKL